MKKHVLGIVFFVSIVVLSAVVYGLVSLYSIPTIEDPNTPVLEYPKNCYPDFVSEEIKIVQAIATPSERSLVLDLGRGKSMQSSRATLVFHSANEQGAKFVSSEVVDVPGNSGVAKYTFDWLKNIRHEDNLYVSIRLAVSRTELGDAEFSKTDATAILIAKK